MLQQQALREQRRLNAERAALVAEVGALPDQPSRSLDLSQTRLPDARAARAAPPPTGSAGAGAADHRPTLIVPTRGPDAPPAPPPVVAVPATGAALATMPAQPRVLAAADADAADDAGAPLEALSLDRRLSLDATLSQGLYSPRCA
eukprot:scaffold54770_cov63-Phaeocystis_antarctica.AAC.2